MKIEERLKNPVISVRFKKYYPSMGDMNLKQRLFYRYWLYNWKRDRALNIDTSYIFVYLYSLIKKYLNGGFTGEGVIAELERVNKYYNEQVGFYIPEWIADILEEEERYEEALDELLLNQKNKCFDINRILNLKNRLNKPINGEDVICLAERLGLKLNKHAKEHKAEAVGLCEDELYKFKKQHKEFLTYVNEKYSYFKKIRKEFFGGVPVSSERVSALQYLHFLEIYFVVNFSVNCVSRVNLKLKEKYQKRKISKTHKSIPDSVRERLQELKLYQPFKNPAASISEEGCNHDYLQLVNHWETYRKYECINCQKEFMCKSDQGLVEALYPHQVKGEWLPGICPKCRGLNDLSPVTKGKLMYGSTFYAKHWREISLERDSLILKLMEKEGVDRYEAWDRIDRNYAENRVRKRYGVPLIGEGWVSETMLYKTLKKIFSKNRVIHHARPEWLKPLELDIFIPELKIAFEYQGRQHYEPVDFFGGEEAFEELKKRDRKKKRLCKENGIKLFEIKSGEDFSESTLKGMVSEYLDE